MQAFNNNPHITGFKQANTHYLVYDIVFILCALAYAWLAWHGIAMISASGAILDSDLQTYAQGMAGACFPALFTADPVLHNVSAANSIPNLQRMLAAFFLENDNFGLALLKAGSIAIFLFYVFWYALGRFLFTSPAVAALCAVCAGITIWIDWGTFWGVTHSDPVPRVFFAAFFPLLLMLAIYAVQKTLLRPVAMFACGLAMWLHGVSALNFGAMIYMAFVFLKPAGISTRSHLFNLVLCLVAFFTPVLVFLWPSLGQTHRFDKEQLMIFREMFDLRWGADYSGFGQRLINFLTPPRITFFMILCGLVSWLLLKFRARGYLGILRKMCPAFALALGLVTAFCWCETWLAPHLGRLPMGHELVRGLRFLMPLAWLMIIGVVSCYTGKWPRRIILAIVCGTVLWFNQDRQHEAAQYALAQYLPVEMPLLDNAREDMRKAENLRDILTLAAEIIPPGEPVYSNEDIMGIRYMARRPLAHAFKDGYVFFYNKDFPNSQKWLENEKLASSSPLGCLEIWKASNAPWFLTSSINRDELRQYGDIVADKNGWLIAKKRGNL